MTSDSLPRPRLDKWLWAARFYRTRALAAQAASQGRISVNGQAAKPGREIRLDDRVVMRQGALERSVIVRRLEAHRGPAEVAQTLYEETPESVAARERAAEQRRLGVEPAAALVTGRPTKRDRRRLATWQRWSASVDDLP
jgi:ribosome-associated heat shock protein Hsp15